MTAQSPSIAYFSIEIALEDHVPTYSGGMGVLIGDTVRAAADLHVPSIAVSLLYRKGCFRQFLDSGGTQREEPVEWDVKEFVKELPARACVKIEGREVWIRVWQYDVKGADGYTIPVYLLDTDLSDNSEWDRSLTHYLYRGDARYRFCQQVILGIGGVRILRTLGLNAINNFHMHEAHPALLVCELFNELRRERAKNTPCEAIVEEVRKRCIFTTHTYIASGYNIFPLELVKSVLGEDEFLTRPCSSLEEETLNLTRLGINLSRYVNGLARKHGEITGTKFPDRKIDYITSGVHAVTWTSQPFQALFDKYIVNWRKDNSSLRHALAIPGEDVLEAHQRMKRELLSYVQKETGIEMRLTNLTIGFARRITGYKRPSLFFQDVERLRQIAREKGPIQIVFAGKTYPNDPHGNELIREVFKAQAALAKDLHVAYLQNYNLALGRLMTAGVDIWLNTPQPPMEASGISGMKSALNGVPSLSAVDGWWLEGCIEGVTGWSIDDEEGDLSSVRDMRFAAASLYRKLEEQVLPTFYGNQSLWQDMMKHAIAMNGSFFHTQRIVSDYMTKAYFVGEG